MLSVLQITTPSCSVQNSYLNWCCVCVYRSLRTRFNEKLVKIRIYLFKRMYLKMLSVKMNTLSPPRGVKYYRGHTCMLWCYSCSIHCDGDLVIYTKNIINVSTHYFEVFLNCPEISLPLEPDRVFSYKLMEFSDLGQFTFIIKISCFIISLKFYVGSGVPSARIAVADVI